MTDISACTFIRNNMVGGFCVFESMASWLPMVDEFVVLDLGSTDGTLELLQVIADANPKVRLEHGSFPVDDASAFADVMNHAISLCSNDAVVAYQADEIPHPDLLRRVETRFVKAEFDLSFWRYQLRNNFQKMKWPPHLIHRVGKKRAFTFVDDGMNTSRTWDAKICSEYDGGWFIRWGDEFKGRYPELPTHDMVLDVGKSGAFRDCIAERARLHFPFWSDGEPNVDGVSLSQWVPAANADPDWTKTSTPYNIPPVMRWHLGKVRYYLRDSLYKALQYNTTEEMVGL